MTDIHTVNSVVSAVTVSVVCECGADATYDIDLECEDIGPGWVVPMEERFILCETCESVIDAGLVFSISPPAPGPDDEGEPESRDYIRGWNDAIKTGRDLVQIDPPPAPAGDAT